MNKQTFIKWSGMAAMAAAILSITIEFLNNTLSPEILWAAVNLMLLMALTGMYLYLRPDGGKLGLTGYLFAMLGDLILLFDFYDSMYIIGGSIIATGIIILSISAFNTEKFPRWVLITLILVCLLGIPSLFFNWDAIRSLDLGLGFAFALGLFGLGYNMWGYPLKLN